MQTRSMHYVALLSVLLVVPAIAADTGYKQLFNKSKGISVQDQIRIYDQLKLKFAKDDKTPDGAVVHQFTLADEGCDPAPYEVEVTDLNNDRTPEVFVEGGDACTSGMTGGTMWLFIKSQSGYRMNLGFPAGMKTILPQRSKGFPDLRLVAATGPCDEVWRWNGDKYTHSRDVETFKGGCKQHIHWSP
jgi:hypothetical protein